MWITFDLLQSDKNYPHTLKIKGIFIHRRLHLFTGCEQNLNPNKNLSLKQNKFVDSLV